MENTANPAINQRDLAEPQRMRRLSDYEKNIPVHVVWEITLACDLKCLHCGSRAGSRRPQELNTSECLDVVAALARLGTREITLIGGEFYLRKDWLQIIAAIREHGMRCTVQSGGKNLSEKILRNAVHAGMSGLGISIDGLEDLHDNLRGVKGSYRAAIRALQIAKELDLKTSVNTQIGAKTMSDLQDLFDVVVEVGAGHWQLQLTVAMGNAVDNDWTLLQPYQLADLMPIIADFYFKGLDKGLMIVPGNNIGYFGPYEHFLRQDIELHGHWGGCSAGETVIGIEADGTVKGCPSLPTVGYAGGNVRDLSLEMIWAKSEEVHLGRPRSTDDLWGFCKTCYYADVCRGGCTWTSHSLLGKPGNNPYCHYRVLELKKEGLRERIVKTRDAPRESFATGEFAIVKEVIDSTSTPLGLPLSSHTVIQDEFDLAVNGEPKTACAKKADIGHIPTKLKICRSCNQFIYVSEEQCPHCNSDIHVSEENYRLEILQRQALIQSVEELLGLNNRLFPKQNDTG